MKMYNQGQGFTSKEVDSYGDEFDKKDWIVPFFTSPSRIDFAMKYYADWQFKMYLFVFKLRSLTHHYLILWV